MSGAQSQPCGVATTGHRQARRPQRQMHGCFVAEGLGTARIDASGHKTVSSRRQPHQLGAYERLSFPLAGLRRLKRRSPMTPKGATMRKLFSCPPSVGLGNARKGFPCVKRNLLCSAGITTMSDVKIRTQCQRRLVGTIVQSMDRSGGELYVGFRDR